MLRDSVLENLIGNCNNYLSGQKLAQKLGVSRNAINLCVRALRDLGWDILSSTNKGYKLNSCSNILHELLVSPAQKDLSIFKQIKVLNSVPSTSKYLVEAGLSQVDNMVLITNEQSQGLSQSYDLFPSPNTQGLYLSFLLNDINISDDDLGILLLESAKEIIEIYSDKNMEISYPKGLLCDGYKYCASLNLRVINTEGKKHFNVIGIGFYCGFSSKDQGDLKDLMREETIDRNSFAKKLIKAFDRKIQERK